MSLQIRPGEFVAFVGDSGCGKSTLLRLLLGFERCSSGTIYYDGQDLNSLDLRLVRRQMGVVLQVSRVMPTDIYRNIVGVSTRTEDDAWDAAEMAGLADDIRAMPMRMHTYVAEGGSTLSGGQRQRLLIARAIVNRPRLLFLDEATSALDNQTQAIVSESLERLDATRVVIAHRLSTIVNADRICMLDGGRIAEMGTLCRAARARRPVCAARAASDGVDAGRPEGLRYSAVEAEARQDGTVAQASGCFKLRGLPDSSAAAAATVGAYDARSVTFATSRPLRISESDGQMHST